MCQTYKHATICHFSSKKSKFVLGLSLTHWNTFPPCTLNPCPCGFNCSAQPSSNMRPCMPLSFQLFQVYNTDRFDPIFRLPNFVLYSKNFFSLVVLAFCHKNSNGSHSKSHKGLLSKGHCLQSWSSFVHFQISRYISKRYIQNLLLDRNFHFLNIYPIRYFGSCH